MEAGPPPPPLPPSASPPQPAATPANTSCEEADADSTIHGFNAASNVTVIEKAATAGGACEGSDSGVEVAESAELRRAGSHDFDRLNGARSCDSSIISYCSNYEEAYNILVRKNSTLLEDYTLRNGDVTSENGSESSSISGSQPRIRRTHLSNTSKKKVSLPESKNKTPSTKDRSRSKPPTTPSRSSTSSARLKSLERVQGKTPTPNAKPTSSRTSKTPNSLDVAKKEPRRPLSSRSSSTNAPTKTVQATSDDGRWPSVHSRPAPLMSRSLKGSLDQKFSKMDNKTIEKYATLPRRKKEKSSDNVKDIKKQPSRENSLHRLVVAKKSSREMTPSKNASPHCLPKPKQKTKIYHETCIQTALTMSDVEKALSGLIITPKDPSDSEKSSKEVQVDMRLKDVEKLREELRHLTEKHEALLEQHKSQTDKLKETEERLKEETLEKEGLRLELTNNSERVLSILGKGNVSPGESSSDSLMVLESRFQNVSHVVIQQEEEIARLNSFIRALQRDLDKSVAAQKNLLQQQQDLEAEGIELQEFMQAEKTTLTDALKEAEVEINRQQSLLAQKERELGDQQRANGSLRSRLASLEMRSRELLVQQGSAVSGAAVALSALVDRLRGLVDELVVAYAISEQELEDAVFHNEAYHNSASSPESTPERSSVPIPHDKDPSPKSTKPGGSSFVSAVINAIRNAAGQTPFSSNGGRDPSRDDLGADCSGSSEMLDSETEPCLMMEHVLEDVVVPDGHSHNMISSGHGSMLTSRLTHSESLKDLPQSLFGRQISEPSSFSYAGSLNASLATDMVSISELFPSVSLVDQVIEVDNLITRLLKVIRIIQTENEEYMNELQDHRDSLEEQIDQQKETNKVVVKQLKDWEVLGARLKTEVKELMAQLSRKNSEMDGIKCELNKQREQVEKLNQDVCELSTALAKAELETRMKEEEVSEEIKKWEKNGEMPTAEILGRLVVSQNEVPILKEKLADKEKRLSELTQEFLTSRQVLTESFKDAVSEAKKQYDAIDNALEVLHSIQTVVQQCQPLTKLQHELEEISFQSASAMPLVVPPDFNANAALLQAVSNLEVAPTINTTA